MIPPCESTDAASARSEASPILGTSTAPTSAVLTRSVFENETSVLTPAPAPVPTGTLEFTDKL